MTREPVFPAAVRGSPTIDTPKPAEPPARQDTISVLLVCDEPSALCEMLAPVAVPVADTGFEVRRVRDVARASEVLSESPPDCVVVDLCLHGSPSLETFEALQVAGPETPIVVLSNPAEERLAHEAMHRGAQDYLIKERTDLALLMRSIAFAIDRKRAERSARANDVFGTGDAVGTGERAKDVVGTGTVSILFTDLVRSTELRARLGEDVFAEILGRHFRLLHEAIVQHGGEEVKNLGDGVMAAFNSAVDAVSCAVAIQQSVHAQSRRSPPGAVFQIRVGLDVGEPIREQGDYFGSSVTLAKRLCDSAEAGQILVSELVPMLTGRRGDWSFDNADLLDLKGFTEPVPAYEVLWKPEHFDGRISLPPGLTMPVHTSFTGRSLEMGKLENWWSEAMSGGHRQLFVTGEPGIGKTRLVSEFCRRLHREGATVLYGRCLEEPSSSPAAPGSSLPFQPWVDALGHYVAACPPAELREQVDGRSELCWILPELVRRVPDLSAPGIGRRAAKRQLLFESVTGLLERASFAAPLVLVLDDLQWADRSSLMLLRHMARSLTSGRVLVLAVYRQTDVVRKSALSSMLAQLRHDDLYEELCLAGLDEDNVAAMVRERVGHEARPAFIRALTDETGGNPFFVEEVLRHLAEQDLLCGQDRSWCSCGGVGGLSGPPIEGWGVPEGVKDAIGAQLDRIGEPARRLVSIASVTGREFDVQLLEAMGVLPAEQLWEALEEALLADIIEEYPGGDGRFRFRHPMIRGTLYAALPAARRVRLHREVGEALEGLLATNPQAYLPALAYHFFEAREVVPVGKAVDYAQRAAQAAFEQSAYEDAADQYARALTAADRAEDFSERWRCELLIALGSARERAGETPSAREAFRRAAETAKRSGNTDQFARAALGYAGRGWQGFGEVDQVQIGLLEDVLAMLPRPDSELRVNVLARLAESLYFVGPPERVSSLGEEAVAMARRLGAARSLAQGLVARHWGLWNPDHAEQRLAVADELLTAAVAAGEPELRLIGLGWRIADLVELGRLDEADLEMETHAQIAEAERQPYFLWLATAWRSMRAIWDGRFTDGERWAQEAWAIGQQAAPHVSSQTLGAQTILLRDLRGRLGEFLDALEGIAGYYTAIPAWKAALAYAQVKVGREEGRGNFERLAQDDFRSIPRDVNYLGAHGFLALTCIALGDERRAPQLYELLRPYDGRLIVSGGAVVCAGAVSEYLGRLAASMSDHSRAAEHFEDAIRAYQRFRGRPWLANTQHEYAKMLRQRNAPGDRDRAEELQREAMNAADEMGMELSRSVAVAVG